MEDHVKVHVVCGGGGTGWFSWSWGAENSFVSKTTNMIRRFCEQLGETFVEDSE